LVASGQLAHLAQTSGRRVLRWHRTIPEVQEFRSCNLEARLRVNARELSREARHFFLARWVTRRMLELEQLQ